ncbi:MAG TPA: A24 family peptidase [Tepidisphaeraceae bacterium]|nr:A24 family peptidase [Tepidisphaeraceae bacterium]
MAVIASLAAAVVDLKVRRIPNVLTGPLLLGGLIWSAAIAGWSGLGESVAGVVIVGFPFFLLWMLRAGGAGDAKMMMALGAWLGVMNGVAALLGVALAGGVVALGYALARRQVLSTGGNMLVMMLSALFLFRGSGRFSERQESIPSFRSPQGIPYGVAICVGTCAAAVWMWVARS